MIIVESNNVSKARLGNFITQRLGLEEVSSEYVNSVIGSNTPKIEKLESIPYSEMCEQFTMVWQNSNLLITMPNNREAYLNFKRIYNEIRGRKEIFLNFINSLNLSPYKLTHRDKSILSTLTKFRKCSKDTVNNPKTKWQYEGSFRMGLILDISGFRLIYKDLNQMIQDIYSVIENPNIVFLSSNYNPKYTGPIRCVNIAFCIDSYIFQVQFYSLDSLILEEYDHITKYKPIAKAVP
ncbi:MAG: hypothetical protein WCK98_05305 [bacterium]